MSFNWSSNLSSDHPEKTNQLNHPSGFATLNALQRAGYTQGQLKEVLSGRAPLNTQNPILIGSSYYPSGTSVYGLLKDALSIDSKLAQESAVETQISATMNADTLRLEFIDTGELLTVKNLNQLE